MQSAWIGDALAAALTRDGKEGLSRQLTRWLRQWIGEGKLAADTRLPASRDLARQLGIGRNTVIDAYEQLLAEGYLDTRHGSGTFVCALFKRHTVAAPEQRTTLGLSDRGQTLEALTRRDDDYHGAFVPCIPEIRAFPHRQWQQLLARHQRQARLLDFNYQAGGGLPALRQALADYLQMSRAVRCHPDQILITQGTQHSLALCALLLADPGDVAWMEEPGYLGARVALHMAGLQTVAAPVDEHGLDPEKIADPRPPKLIYATPSYQYPLGVTMPLARRLTLIDHARQANAWIIEDDYDSEFRYSSQPLPALQGLSEDARVIYLGTLSKVMYPGLRTGYIVVPETLVDAFRAANTRLNPEGHYPLQSALAEFIENGQFARHIRRMRDLYQERQHCLRAVVADSVASEWAWSSGHAGMHVLATLPPHLDETRLSQMAALEGIWLATLGKHFQAPPDRQGLVIGYAGVTEQDIRRGVGVMDRLARAHL
ncbi:PLP-dependent aminotransferase family protein [Paludibacterium purpuratum]|uniref:Putative 8-amino-7-oxononanoate synthase n=1 Tax=Paludibacterium purpuratum TaxID=1144873 RepID=A0A4V3DVG6_9NEIS|nr:PLP-dependent aminotransferase family protein [Paludibacterium purpuratum]TDR80699.1 GntR family transcriptional regulator [Paludibacterium purpuratum]